MLTICDKEKGRVEVDTGSQGLILNTRYMKALHIDPADQQLKRSESKDETGHLNTRYYTRLPCRIKLKTALSNDFSQSTPAVMFQKIIYDGLIGDTFLRQFTVTYDLPHSQMLFAKQE
jgi:hypothetical protein